MVWPLSFHRLSSYIRYVVIQIWTALSWHACTYVQIYISCTYPMYLSPLHTIWASSLSLRRRRGEAGLCRVNVNVLTPLPKIRARPALRSPLNSNPLLTVSTSVLATSVLLAAGYSVSREDFLARGLRDSRTQAAVLFFYLRIGRVQKSNSRGCLRAAQVVLWASKVLFKEKKFQIIPLTSSHVTHFICRFLEKPSRRTLKFGFQLLFKGALCSFGGELMRQ